MEGQPFRVRPAYVILDLGPNFQELAQHIRSTGIDATNRIYSTVNDLVQYLSSKLDSPGNLVELCNDLSLKDYKLGELTYAVGSTLFNSLISNGLYDTDGLSFYDFIRFVDDSCIMLEYNTVNATSMFQGSAGQLEIVNQILVKSMMLDDARVSVRHEPAF